LITDLAPMDVLLQRIGQLHRHDRDGQRPKGFDAAKAIVLTPFDFDASLAAITRDRNGPHGLGGLVYGNLVSLAATRERIGGGAAWTIPSMNRELLEAATHPVTLEAVKDRLAARDKRWEEIWRKTLGASTHKDRRRASRPMCTPIRTVAPNTRGDARSRQCSAAAAPSCWTPGEGERVEDRGGRGACGQSFVGFLSLGGFRGFALSGRLGEPIGAVAGHGPLGRAPFFSLVLR
jgi:hypothetical protein